MPMTTAIEKIRAAQVALNGFIEKNLLRCAAINANASPSRDQVDAMEDMAEKIPDFAGLLDNLIEAMFVCGPDFERLIADTLHDAGVAYHLHKAAGTILVDLAERRTA